MEVGWGGGGERHLIQIASCFVWGRCWGMCEMDVVRGMMGVAGTCDAQYLSTGGS